MKLVLVILFVVSALAAPQGVEEDAEVVPRRTVPGAEGGARGGGDGFVIVVPHVNPFTHFFRNFFASRRPSVPDFDVDEAGDFPRPSVLFDSAPETPRRPGGFFSLIDSLFPLLTSPSENATITFQNSTVEVVNIGGVPMLLNRTVVEHTNEDGSVFRRVDQRIVGPQDDDTSTTTSIPADEDAANELVSETSNTHNHTIKKRWIVSWLKDALRRRNTPSGTSTNHLSETEHRSRETETDATNRLIPIENESDIAVNYLGNPPVNPDAEVFDDELMRESERRFWEARGNSVVSQPLRSQPLRSQPLRSQPLRSQPMPIRSQPLRSNPMMSEPLRSNPEMSRPIRSHYMMSQPIRTQPKMSQPLRSSPRMSQPLRSQPRMFQPLRSQPIMSQSYRTHPVRL